MKKTHPGKFLAGFTLFEIVVVIAIIGVITAIVLALVNNARVGAREAARAAQISQVVRALEAYYEDNNSYPPNLSGATPAVSDYIPRNWKNMMQALVNGKYISATFAANFLAPADDFENPLVKIAYAAGGISIYYPCSIQDPLYKVAGDYGSSYGYMSSLDGSGSGFRIRVKLEKANNQLFGQTMEGKFLYSFYSGSSGSFPDCSKILGYFCTGAGNF